MLNLIRAGQLEATIHRTFVRSSNLRRWFADSSASPAITTCKQLFDAYLGTSSDNYIPGFAEDDDVEQQGVSIPADLRPLVGHLPTISLRARLRTGGMICARSTTHIGNSLVMFKQRSNTKASSEAIPGSIQYIYKHTGCWRFAVRRQLGKPQGVTDPFLQYADFPAKIYSSRLSPVLEQVDVDSVLCHYVRWSMNSQLVVVLEWNKVW
jgi:hypothetical protein